MTNKPAKQGRIAVQNKKRIIAAAEQEFAVNGFKGTRIQTVADRANLPKTNVLYYFQSKEGLYVAVLEQILGLWNSAFDKADEQDDPAKVLAHYISEKMEISRTMPEASKIFALEIINGAPNLRKFFQEHQIRWMESRVGLLNSWITQGRIQARDPYYLLFNIWACCQHYADFSAQIEALKGKPMEQEDFREATKSLIQMVLGGCGLQVPQEYC